LQVPRFAKCCCLKIDQAFGTFVGSPSHAFDAVLDQANRISATNRHAVNSANLHLFLQRLQIFIVRRRSDQDRVFRLEYCPKELGRLGFAVKTVVGFIDDHADAKSLLAQRNDQFIHAGIGFAGLTHAPPVLQARGDELPRCDENIARPSANDVPVLGQCPQPQPVKLLAQECRRLIDNAFERREPKPDDLIDA
jgi:hypothetical protein